MSDACSTPIDLVPVRRPLACRSGRHSPKRGADGLAKRAIYGGVERQRLSSQSVKAHLRAATADHLEQTNEAEIVALAEAGVLPVLLPGSVYALGLTRYPKARAMIEAGLAVVLATDFNPGSSPTPSIPMVLSLAATQMKMTPAEGVTATTINAAYSLNRGDKIGSLEVGKRADFAIFECADYREIAYWFGTPQVQSVYVRGERAV